MKNLMSCIFVILIVFVSGCSSNTTLSRENGNVPGDAGSAGIIETGGNAGIPNETGGNETGGLVEETGGTNTGGSILGSGGNTGGSVQETGGMENETGGSNPGTGSTNNTGGNENTGGLENCPDGTEDCPCYGNDTCNDSLVCNSGTCVSFGAGGAGGNGGSQNTAGTETGGIGGNTCIPKTCLTIAVELSEDYIQPDQPTKIEHTPEACGLVDDGCGNTIDCGTCDFGECGVGLPPTDWGNAMALHEGVPNLCGGGCVFEDPLEDCGYEDDPEHFVGFVFYCTDGFEPTWNTVKIACWSSDSSTPNTRFCCNPNH